MDGLSPHQSRKHLRLFATLLVGASAMWPAALAAQTSEAPLVLEAKIALGEVSGRIDHLAIDIERRRLFVAELGNNTLGVVDLAAGRVLRTIPGFREPQGVAYVPFADSIYVANGGDGSVAVLRGEDLAPTGRIELREDADNVRVDLARRRVLVGYGKGALAVIDPATRAKVADIRLKGHPEGFQIDELGPRYLSMYRTPATSRSPTLRRDRPVLCRWKERHRIFRWRSMPRHSVFSSSFAARRP